MFAVRSRPGLDPRDARVASRCPPVQWLLVVLAVALCGLSALAADFALPVELKWTRKTLGPGSYASIVVDPAGNPHVLYNRESKGYALTHVFYEGKKRRTEVVATDAGYGNALAVDADGGVHALYARESFGVGWQLIYARRDGSGWQTEVLEPGAQSPSLQVDALGVVHALHIDGSGSGLVRYLRSTPMGWEGEDVYPSGLWFGDSALVLDGDEVHAVFCTDELPRALVVATRDAGGEWTPVVVDDGASGDCLDPSAVLDGEGTLHVAYVRGGAVVHAWREGMAWNQEDLVTEGTFFGIPFPEFITFAGEDTSLALDPRGRPFLAGGLTAFSGPAQVGLLWFASLEDGTWTPGLVGGATYIYRAWTAVGTDGLPRVVATIGSKLALFTVKGNRLQLKVKPKGAGTLLVEPAGTECADKLRMELFPGTALTVTATPAEGYAFSEWRGACESTDPTCELVMDTKRKLLAVFTAVEAP